MKLHYLQYLFLLCTTIYHHYCNRQEKRTRSLPGKIFNIDRCKLHLYGKGEGNVTVIVDSSLGGIEGYFLIDRLSKLTKVYIYDRPGYGWSQRSKKTRCSQEIVSELDLLLTTGNIKAPFILVGDSFGSYNMRLYAHRFPEKIKGIVLTDGLHERGMLNMPLSIIILKLFFLSGFLISIFGSWLGIVRFLGNLGIFELIKPELRKFPQDIRQQVKKSFYKSNHWITMAKEIWHIDLSGRQLIKANNFGNLPIVAIKSQTFLKPSIFTWFLPISSIDKLRDKIHQEFSNLSTNYTEIKAHNSSHFVWIDEPQLIVNAVEKILNL